LFGATEETIVVQPLLIVLIVVLVPFLFGIIIALFQWLWNTTMPQVFDMKAITFWQACRLLILAAALFGSGAIFRINLIRF
jgi:succinate dehydrogenase hydrophobic anchor subunit